MPDPIKNPARTRRLTVGIGIAVAAAAGVALVAIGPGLGDPSGRAIGEDCADGDAQTHAVIGRPPNVALAVPPLRLGVSWLLAGSTREIEGIAVDPGVQRLYSRDRSNDIHVADAKTGVHIATSSALRTVTTIAGGGLDTRCGMLLADVRVGGVSRLAEIDPTSWTVRLERTLPLGKGETVGAIAYRLDDDAVLVLVRSGSGASVREVNSAGVVIAQRPFPVGLQTTALELEPGTNELIGIVTTGDRLARHLDLATGNYTVVGIGLPHGEARDLSLTIVGLEDDPGRPDTVPRRPIPPDVIEPEIEQEGRPETGDHLGGACPQAACGDRCGVELDQWFELVETTCWQGWGTALGHACGGPDEVCGPAPGEADLREMILAAVAQVSHLRQVLATELAGHAATGTWSTCSITRVHVEKAERELHNLLVEWWNRRITELAASEAQGCDVAGWVRSSTLGRDALATQFAILLSIGGAATLLTAYEAGGVLGAMRSFFLPGIDDVLGNLLTHMLGIEDLPGDLSSLVIDKLDLRSLFTIECPPPCPPPMSRNEWIDKVRAATVGFELPAGFE